MANETTVSNYAFEHVDIAPMANETDVSNYAFKGIDIFKKKMHFPLFCNGRDCLSLLNLIKKEWNDL